MIPIRSTFHECYAVCGFDRYFEYIKKVRSGDYEKYMVGFLNGNGEPHIPYHYHRDTIK